MMKHYIKIWAILFIFSATPIITVHLLELFQIKDLSKDLIGKDASPIIFSSKRIKKLPLAITDRYKNQSKIVYLTFDDGPNRHTIEIVKALKSKNVQATFFLLKYNIDKNPDILKLIVENGNTVGCHGVSHRIDVFYSNVMTAVDEMRQCQRAIHDVSQIHSPLIRVPFGSYPHLTHEQKQGLEDAGFIYWDWNIDSEDWTIDDDKKVLENIKKQLHFIESKGFTPTVLLHDKEVTAKMLPKLLDVLLEKGYEIRPLKNDIKPVQFNRFLTPAS